MSGRFWMIGGLLGLAMAVGTACGDDDDDGGGGTTSAGTTATGTGGTGTGTGGGGAGGGSGGAGGAGGADCATCDNAGEQPFGNFTGTYCDAEAETLYEALVECTCQACTSECGTSWVCTDDGPEPDATCESCYEAAFLATCTAPYEACLADVD